MTAGVAACAMTCHFFVIARESSRRPKQSTQPTPHVSIDCRALVPRARNDVFSPRHCEGVRRTTEAIHSTNAACLYRLPRSLRSLAMTHNFSHSFLVIARSETTKQSSHQSSHQRRMSLWIAAPSFLGLAMTYSLPVIARASAGRPKQSSQPASHVFMDCRAHFVRCLGFPYRSLLSWTSLRCRPLRTRSPD